MSIGLDLGSTQFRSLRCADQELVGRHCRAVYVVLSDTAGHRRLLEQSGVRFAVCGDDLVLFGEPALEWSDMLNLPLVALLPDGRVPQSDAVARQILTLMIDAVLPPASQLGDVCCLTVPGGHDISRSSLPYDVRFFQQLVALRGYQPKLISPGLAVVLAELADASFSGIGISFGAANCQIGVIHCGRELAYCSLPGLNTELSADMLDPTMPLQDDGHPIPADRVIRAAREQSLMKALKSTLTVACDELLRLGVIRWISQPTHVVCTGGPTAEVGFSRLFAQAWSQLNWSMKVGHVRVATDAIYSIARGALIQARLESRDAKKHRAA